MLIDNPDSFQKCKHDDDWIKDINDKWYCYLCLEYIDIEKEEKK